MPVADRAVGAKPRALLWQGVSLTIHLGLLGAGAAASPILSATEESSPPGESAYLVHAMILPAAEREAAARDLRAFVGGTETPDDGGGFGFMEGSEGKMGSDAAQTVAGRATAQGPDDYPDPGPTQRGLRDSETCCVIGPLKDPAGDLHGFLTSRDTVGADPQSTAANMDGAHAVDAAGRDGTAPAGMGKGSRPTACVPGRGIAAIPARRSHWSGGAGSRVPISPNEAPSGTPALRRVTSSRPFVPQQVVCDDSGAQ